MERSLHLFAHMRGSESLVGVVAVAIPILIAVAAWSWVENWVSPPAQPVPTPQVAGGAATSSAAARATRTPVAAQTSTRPMPDASGPVLTRESVQPRPTADIARPWPTAVLEPAAETLTGDPSAAVSTFYSLVSSHQFDSAAQLWSPRMRAAFPPTANLNERFSQTQFVRLQRVDVLSQDQSQATVAVDLLELDGQSGQHHFVGNWYLVRGAGGWLLDQPQLTAAP